MRLWVAPAARDQIRAASQWWDKNRPAAPDLFREELRRAIELVTSQPGSGAPVLDTGFEAVRRINLGRSRYHLYYQSVGDTVEVLALWHTSRGEGPPIGGTNP